MSQRQQRRNLKESENHNDNITTISTKTKIIEKSIHKNIINSMTIKQQTKSYVKSSATEQTKKRAVQPKNAKDVNKSDTTFSQKQSGNKTSASNQKNKISSEDIVFIALNEVRKEHSNIGNYNFVVGKLVMKQRERKELAEMSETQDRHEPSRKESDNSLKEFQNSSFS